MRARGYTRPRSQTAEHDTAECNRAKPQSPAVNDFRQKQIASGAFLCELRRSVQNGRARMFGLNRPLTRAIRSRSGLEIQGVENHDAPKGSDPCCLCAAGSDARAKRPRSRSSTGSTAAISTSMSGFESTSGTLNDATTFRLYDEDGTKTVEQRRRFRRVHRLLGRRPRLAQRVGGHRLSSGGHDEPGRRHGLGAQPAGLQPPPQRRRRRPTISSAANARIHLQFGYMLPLNDKLDVHVYAGPSFFHLSQDVVSRRHLHRTAAIVHRRSPRRPS